MVLQEKGISFNFIASECVWNCSFLSVNSHVSFVVRVYRLPEELGNQYHVIELQRLDGDALEFYLTYEALDKNLCDSVVEMVHVYPNPVGDWTASADITIATSVDASELIPSVQVESVKLAESANSVLFELPSLEKVKSVIVATLKHGHQSAIIESTQFACSIYSEEELIEPSAVDIECMRELMKIVVNSKTNSYWASQHAVWTLASMSRSSEYSKLMLVLEEEGEMHVAFIRAIYKLSTSETFDIQQMRRKCVELLINLHKTYAKKVYDWLCEENIRDWLDSEYVKEVLVALGN